MRWLSLLTKLTWVQDSLPGGIADEWSHLRSVLSHNTPKSDGRPNILIILTDDQDDHMRSLDYMPNVQKHIIQEGSYHSQHYCTIALCCPSRSSLWSGLHGHNHNVTDVGGPYGGYDQVVRQGIHENNIFSWMQTGGYATYYAGKLYNGQSEDNYNNPPVKGFDRSDLFVGSNVYWYENVSYTRDFGPIQYSNGYYSTDLISNKFTQPGGYFDEASKGDKPWIMVAAPTAPHVQIGPARLGGVIRPVPAERHRHLFNDYKIPRTPDYNPDTIGGASYYRQLPKLNQTVLDYNDEFQRLRLRTLQAVDDMVGSMIGKLRETGQLDNTYIIYTTDNGFHISQHRLTGGKECGLETDIRIPFAVRGPGIQANSSNEAVTNHVDMSGTLLALSGVDPPPDVILDGAVIPMTPQLSQETASRREHTSVEFWGDALNNLDGGIWTPTQFGPQGWRNNTFYSVRVIGDGYSYYYAVWCTNERELYDMKSDPYQLNNLFYDEAGQTHYSFSGRRFNHLVNRLDTLLLTLKTCRGDACRAPWSTLLPHNTVKSLSDAMDPSFDMFFESQPKVSYSECLQGHLLAAEGPQAPVWAEDATGMTPNPERSLCEEGPLLWF